MSIEQDIGELKVFAVKVTELVGSMSIVIQELLIRLEAVEKVIEVREPKKPSDPA